MFAFLKKEKVIQIHAILIDEFGGSHGLRDEGSLESALNAPLNRAHYENADLVICAATYAYHLCQAHAFVDGNKRIAAATAEIFLELNNAILVMDDDALIHLIFDIATDRISRSDVEEIFAKHIQIIDK
ncbi:type II toxin-antitoxin system death-on-curing family toxin [Chloroflexi bacterium TSY]|nr:type II toxin-antitoxin system death-on-curing family toxin [Chloroflexi bacterium TSY]